MLRSHRAGFPRDAPTAFVDDSAQVIGDVEIGEDSSVWIGSLVMGSPGRVRRATTDEAAVSIRRYAENYVSDKREFQAHSS